MSGSRGRWLRLFVQFKLFPTTSICNKSAQRSSFCTSAKNNNNKDIVTDERYQQLENLDMITAAKILFTDPPKKKKFGFDFHLVQFFFACMPSLAVYLVAQYARYEIRRMEGEVEEKKKKKEEEAKEREKELELNPPEENEAKSDAQLSEVKERLDKLEETVKEIAVVTKKQSSSNIDPNQVTGEAKEPQNISAPSNTSGGKDNSLKSKPELDEESVVTKKQSSSNIDTNQVTGEAKEPQNISAPSNTSGGKDNSLKSKPELDEESVVTKKQSSSNIDTNQVTGEAKEPQNISAPSNTSGGKDNSLKSKPELDEESKGSVVTPNSSLQDTTGQNQSEKSS